MDKKCSRRSSPQISGALARKTGCCTLMEWDHRVMVVAAVVVALVVVAVAVSVVQRCCMGLCASGIKTGSDWSEWSEYGAETITPARFLV